MASDTELRQVSRDKLFSIFKTPEAVSLFERLLFATRTTIPGDIAGVQAAVEVHIANTSGAHQAGAIGSTPAGSLSANNVQAALNELDTEKQPTLVSGTNIKTINGASLLGSGNLSLPGTGDVVGPASAVDSNVALFSGTTGKLLKDSGLTLAGTNTGDETAATIATKLALAAGIATFLSTPSSANLLAAVTDETGSGLLVFSTNPTLTNPVVSGNEYVAQGAPASIAAAATLTTAQMLGGIIQYTGVAASLTLPTGALMDAAVVAGLAVDRAFEVSVINTGSGAATIAAGMGFTIVGSATVTNGASAQFRCRKTAANTFIAYRIA